jgi:hypothetical protein
MCYERRRAEACVDESAHVCFIWLVSFTPKFFDAFAVPITYYLVSELVMLT